MRQESRYRLFFRILKIVLFVAVGAAILTNGVRRGKSDVWRVLGTWRVDMDGSTIIDWAGPIHQVLPNTQVVIKPDGSYTVLSAVAPEKGRWTYGHGRIHLIDSDGGSRVFQASEDGGTLSASGVSPRFGPIHLVLVRWTAAKPEAV